MLKYTNCLIWEREEEEEEKTWLSGVVKDVFLLMRKWKKE